MSTAKINLNNPAFDGRLRQPSSARTYQRRTVVYGRTHAPSYQLPTDTLERIATQPIAAPVISHVVMPAPRTFKPAPKPRKQIIRRLRNTFDLRWMKHAKVFVAMAVAMFFIGAATTVMSIRTNQSVKNQVAVLAASTAGDDGGGVGDENVVPSETSPTTHAFKSHNVEPDKPRYLRIPSLSLDARVRSVGIATSGAMQVPNNVYDVGWYDGGAKPGDAAGAIVIDGHVHGPTLPGVFFGLKKLEPGNTISIERGDGEIYSFEVVKSQVFSKDAVDMSSLLVSADTNKLGLNLITCTGAYDYTQKTYLDRLVVYAVQK